MLLLAIDTSAKAASVCLSSYAGDTDAGVTSEPQILGEYFLQASMQHAKTLMPMCAHLLTQCEVDPAQIDLFAISHGPGSFTGLRNGMSALKGMAYAAQKPCLGVSTLDVIAWGASAFVGIVCAVMDARCQQVYHAAYRQTAIGRERLSPDEAVTLEALETTLLRYQQEVAGDLPILLIGDGASLCYETFVGKIPHLRLASPQLRQQRASGVAAAAWAHLSAGGALTPATELVPAYLRLPQAERERLANSVSES